MTAIELACVAIVGLYLGVRVPRDASPGRFLGRFALLMGASWLAEDVVIHVYGFYFYSPRWVPLIDKVPLLVVAIWPVVIQSAWDLARRLSSAPGRVPWVAAAIVLADASLIEPVAVHAGLWWWTEPGLFQVPPVGILGWALFTYIAVAVFARPHRVWALPAWSVLLVGPALVHPGLLLAWWGGLRWVSGTIPPWPAVAVAWAASLTLAAWAWRAGAGARLPLRELLLRVPAAGFFFALLGAYPQGAGALAAYAMAFAPPYLVLTWQAARAARRRP